MGKARPRAEARGVPPELAILHQTKDYIAVDKCHGISIHNVEDPTNLLVMMERQMKHGKFYPVHRLDKETSGVQILARHEAAAKNLAEQFQTRAVQKIYVGLLRGRMTDTQGVWRQPLSDKAEGRRQPAGLARDRSPCETRYRVLEVSPHLTLCEFHLITGRQHQIRKHSALVRHALVGDPRYGEPKYNQKMATFLGDPRMFLHCAALEILGQRIESRGAADWAKYLRPSEGR